MTATNRRWVALLVAALAVTAGCTGAGGGDAMGAEQAGSNGGVDLERDHDASMATGTPMAEPTPGAGAGGAVEDGSAEYQAQQFAERQLILTGQVHVEVADFEAARSNLTEATERYGGFVSDTRQEVRRVDNESWTEGVLVLRVPRDNFTVLFERAKTEGELVDAERNSQDVTDQLVDIQARLENLRAERDQLRELYDRANDTEEILEVQERLSDVQGEIERLEARQQALRERVALSTITVRLREPRPEPDRPVPDRWYDVPLVAAFLESVNGVVVTVRALGVALAYAAPYVVAFGVPLAVVGYAFRRRREGGGGLRSRLSRGGDEEDDADAAGDGSDDGAGEGDESADDEGQAEDAGAPTADQS